MFVSKCDTIYQNETLLLCKTPKRDIAENSYAWGIFFNFELFAKSLLYMHFKYIVKVLDQNVQHKWCTFDDYWPTELAIDPMINHKF